MGSGVAERAKLLAQGIWADKRKRLVAAFVAVVAVVAVVLAVQGAGGGQSAAGVWDLATPEVTESGVEVQLSGAQRREAASVSFTIVRRMSDGYLSVLADIPAQVDAQGKVSLPADPLVLSYVVNGENRPVLMGGYCKMAKDDKLQYCSDELRLSATGDLANDYPGGYDVVRLVATFDDAGMPIKKQITRKNPPYPLGKTVNEDELGLYTAAFYAWKSTLTKVRAEDGTVAPASEWPGGGSISLERKYCDEGIDFRLSPLSAFADEKFCVQLIVEDSEGNKHASDISAKLGPYDKAGAQEETSEVKTDRGTMKFLLSDEYATLVSYEGDEWKLEVPNEVKGLPVRAVGDKVLLHNEYVKEVVLPEGVTTVGASAFRGSAITRFVVPANLTRVGPGAFAAMKHLSAFEMVGKSKSYSVRDGVLFSADGKTLVAYPAGKAGAYVVPEGVSSIAYGAFAGAALSGITLPSSLREIGPYAFADCTALETLDLPEGLERIGSGAFSAKGLGDDGFANITSVRLGPNVSYVGRDAFTGLAADTFEVDAKNRWYKSNGGFLLSKDGMLVQTPMSVCGKVIVPEGVTGLASQSLANILDGTGSARLDQADLYLPESLKTIEEKALPVTWIQGEFGGAAEERIAVRIHAPEGSWAQTYAQKNDIEYDSYYESGTGKMHQKTVKVPKAEMGFKVYADHAVLVSLKAKNAGHVEVPAKVDGVPVTTLGESEDDKTDGYVITLILPPSIEHIEGTLLHKLSTLRRISFEGNETYVVKDGMIFSVDGKTLVACPAAYGKSIEVPEGTTEIGDYALWYSTATSVTLPEGLERIGNSAFYGAFSLTKVEFPQSLRSIGADAFRVSGLTRIELNEGLETIGKQAFSHAKGYEGLSIPDSVTTIGTGAFASGISKDEACMPIGSESLHIGVGLEEVHDEMFSGLAMKSFDVDPQNTHLRAEGPFLLSADGRILYACASGAEGEVTVPDGVDEIASYAFSKIPKVTDVYLPKKLMRVDMLMTFDLYADTDLMLHCPEGSETAALAEEAGMPYTTY